MTMQQAENYLRSTALILLFLVLVSWCGFLASEVHSETNKPSINGFFTLEYEVSNKDATGRRGTFDLHHFNIISKYQITSSSMIFSEIEWEHGADISNDGTLGKIRLERSWYEYAFSPKIKLRAGKFLTPFGNYNVIHDNAPSYTTSILPSSLYGSHGSKGRLFAKFSLGAMLNGSLANDEWEIEYSLFLTNGRGSTPYERDDNANKGVGASFSILSAERKVQLSATAYQDRNNMEGFNTIESAYTGSLRFNLEKFRFESEGVLFRLETGNNTGVYTNKLGGYFQFEYTIKEIFTPVLRLDLFNPDDNIANDLEREYTVGINLAIAPNTFFKSEIHFYDFDDSMQDSYRMFISSLAVAF